MLAVEEMLISEDVVDKKFVCDISRCKGQCCVAGDAGAPLEKEEISILEDLFPCYKEFLTDDGIAIIEKTGFFVINENNEFLTPHVDEKAYCAYAFFEEGFAKCAVERAFTKG